jgi:hypothetical protein
MGYHIFACFLVFSTLLTAQSPSLGSVVSGHVYDSSGFPVSGATIDVLPLNGMSGGSLPTTKTDEYGAYQINISLIGKIRIFARKESRGYPDTRYWIFAPDTLNAPTLTPTGEPITGVDIHFGEAGGIFKGSVIDADTRRPLIARIAIRRIENPRCMISETIRDGVFMYALPKNPVKVTISASGYDEWTYTDKITGKKQLVMQPRQEETVLVEMKLSAKPRTP